MQPSVGRIVHFYYSRTNGPHAAIITGLQKHVDKVVGVFVTIFEKTSPPYHLGKVVPFEEPNAAGYFWVWPTKIEDTDEQLKLEGPESTGGKSEE